MFAAENDPGAGASNDCTCTKLLGPAVEMIVAHSFVLSEEFCWRFGFEKFLCSVFAGFLNGWVSEAFHCYVSKT